MNKMFPLILIIATSISLISCAQKVQQFDPIRLDKSLKENDFTLVYFYSSSCQYCKQFTPKFEQIAKNDKVHGVTYAKMDGPAYKNITQKYDVFSYPSILLFWKNINMPIAFTKQREVIQLQEFIVTTTKVFEYVVKKEILENLTDSARQSGVLYVGDLRTYQHNVTSVLGFLQSYRPFALLQANVTQPYLVIKDQKYYDFDIIQLRKALRKAFAKLYPIQEQSWLRIHHKNEIGIVFADVKNNTEVVKIMEQLATQYPDIVFMRMDPNHEQFRDALTSLGVQKQQNIYGVHKRYDVKFEAPKPYTEQSIRQFVQDVINLKAKIYMRSQKIKKSTPQKLTFKNYEQKVKDSPTDVVIFLYKEQDQNHNKFMDLFRWIIKKLKDNKNLSILRCNLSKNQIEAKLEFPVKITPSIVFFGHRMKDRPVHFSKPVVSAENVIEFIMENTTFDWEDQWGEL